MKKVLVSLMVVAMFFAMAACTAPAELAEPETTEASDVEPAEATEAAAETAQADVASEEPETEGASDEWERGQEINPDFSQNINTNRASEYAAYGAVLPVDGIGRQVTTDLKAKGDYTIGILTKNSTNPIMNGMWKGAEKAAEDLGIKVVTLSPATQDSIEEQVQIMEAQVAQGVDAFVIHPSTSTGIMPGVEVANQAGIPVVCLGTPSDAGSMFRTGQDYYNCGYIVTKEFLEKLSIEYPDGGGVVVLEGINAAVNWQDRYEGMLAALAEYPQFEVLASQTTNWKRAEAVSVMENLLQRQDIKDNLVGVLAALADECAIGAAQAIRSSGMTIGEGGVLLCGGDGNSDGAQAVKDGDIAVSFNTDPFGSTYYACAALVQYLDDGIMPEEYFMPFPRDPYDVILTQENIDDYIDNKSWY